MYSIRAYGKMIADRARTDAFAHALRQVVRRDSVVLDIGTGTGILALLACQFGARRVYAIEPDDAIEVAQQIAAANGYAARIEFIQELSTQATLPEQADVIISDLGGILPWFRHHIPAITDARKRFLAPGGVLIPRRDNVWAAVVEAPDLYRRLVTPWDENQYGLDMQAARRIVTNTWSKARVAREQLLVEPQCWATLDYTIVENPNAPWEPELIYGSVFFPWSTPVLLANEDIVTVALRTDLIGDDYVWCWNTRVLDHDDPGAVKANFKQSTLFGAPLSGARLRKQQANYTPDLDEDGAIDRFILTSMDGEARLEEIARRVAHCFPGRFRRWQDALTRVGELSQKYSR